MTSAIAIWRTTACFVASPVEMQHTESGTTAGGRDKRPRANWRYGIVVVDVFTRRTERHSAAHIAYPLIFQHFHRATRFLRGQTP